jgi:hypothetical protein
LKGSLNGITIIRFYIMSILLISILGMPKLYIILSAILSNSSIGRIIF